jgi:hypothetical protein
VDWGVVRRESGWRGSGRRVVERLIVLLADVARDVGLAVHNQLYYRLLPLIRIREGQRGRQEEFGIMVAYLRQSPFQS